MEQIRKRTKVDVPRQSSQRYRPHIVDHTLSSSSSRHKVKNREHVVGVHLLNGGPAHDVHVVRHDRSHTHDHSPYSSNAQAVFGKTDAFSSVTQASKSVPRTVTRKTCTVKSNGTMQENVGGVTHQHVGGVSRKSAVGTSHREGTAHHRPVVGKSFSMASRSSDGLKTPSSYKGGTPVSQASGLSYHRSIPASKSLDYGAISIPKGTAYMLVL